MEDHGPDSENKWLKKEQMLCLDIIILRGKYDRSLQIFESFQVEERTHFSLQLKP